MEWTDDAIVLSSKNYGESSLILSLLTRNRGRYSGYINSVNKKGFKSTIQPGNLVKVNWRARIEESLGSYKLELIEAYSSNFMYESINLLTLSSICSLCNETLPEREPLPEIFKSIFAIISNPPETIESLICKYIFLELDMLAILGFGLDFSSCVVSGSKKDLTWVSPKSGKAVSYSAGKKYRNKLLSLPSFLIYKELSKNIDEIYSGLILTGYFINKYLYNDYGKKLPINRIRLLNQIKKFRNHE